MRSEVFKIPQSRLSQLKQLHPNLGKNSDVGKFTVEVVKDYFRAKDPQVSFKPGSNGSDIEVVFSNSMESFEIKGTASNNISWPKLKVSSTASHAALTRGMTLIRVTSIGSESMIFYFMKCGEDFELVPEPRWSVVKIKR